VVVLRDLRPEFCVFCGERVIDEGELWREMPPRASERTLVRWAESIHATAASSWADLEGSGMSEALGERAGVL